MTSTRFSTWVPRKSITVSIPDELLSFLKREVGRGRFPTVSNAICFAVGELRERGESEVSFVSTVAPDTNPTGKTRKCWVCHKTKVLHDFTRNPKQPLGYDYICKDCSREKSRDYRRDHPEVVRKWNSRRATAKMRRDVILKLGGVCSSCGQTDIRVLQLNHKNGGGTQDAKSKGGFYRVYSEILLGERRLSDFDVRCANCNILYEYERGRRNPVVG